MNLPSNSRYGFRTLILTIVVVDKNNSSNETLVNTFMDNSHLNKNVVYNAITTLPSHWVKCGY